MRLLNSIAVVVISLGFYACSPLGAHCPDEENGSSTISQCDVKPDAGPCEASITKYYYDASSSSCKGFEWGGCQGSVPFHSLAECQDCSGTGSGSSDNINANTFNNGGFQ